MLTKIIRKKDITEEEASNLTMEEIAFLIRSDPVTCMVNFDHRYKSLLKLLLKPKAGLFAPYEMTDYFNRLEFQMRGSPHSHGLYWIKDAPVYVDHDEESEARCAAFIDEYITSERFEDGELGRLVAYQIHGHTRTCEKKLKRGQKCRFGFPKPPLPTTRILTPLSDDVNLEEKCKAEELYSKLEDKLNAKDWGRDFKEDLPFEDFLLSLDTNYDDYILAVRSSIKRATVFLKRSTNAAFINPYNAELLQAWQANIDIQFILDIYACAKYCVGYILKSDGGVSKLLQAVIDEARKGKLSAKDKLKKFASTLINGSEISAQEAAAFILGISNVNFSRADTFINTAPPEERIRFLRPTAELDDLEDECEDVCVEGLIEHYSKRPEELEDICLAEFASMYEFTKIQKARAGTNTRLYYFINFNINCFLL